MCLTLRKKTLWKPKHEPTGETKTRIPGAILACETYGESKQ